MAEAKRDGNFVKTILGVDKNDGKTTINILVDPVTHRIKMAQGTGGTDLGNGNAGRDQNSKPSLIAASSTDGKTPVAIYADSTTGELLVNKN